MMSWRVLTGPEWSRELGKQNLTRKVIRSLDLVTLERYHANIIPHDSSCTVEKAFKETDHVNCILVVAVHDRNRSAPSFHNVHF